MICHPSAKAQQVAQRFPSHLVIATAGDPFDLPIGHVVVARGFLPIPIPAEQLERCRIALSCGLAIMVGAWCDEVRDDGYRQITDWCLAPGGRG